MLQMHPNIVLISGSGRNSGKTSLGEAIIHSHSSHGVIALKVSNHFHGHYESLNILLKSDHLMIGEELERVDSKDSNRYLKAGAIRSIYAECKDDYLPVLLEWLEVNIGQNTPLVCESGGLGKLIQPGLAFFLKGGSKLCKWGFPYSSLSLSEIKDQVANIRWCQNQWQLKEPLH